MDPQSVIRDIQNAAISKTSQREQLDLLKQINQMHLPWLYSFLSFSAKRISLLGVF
jgi:hypothetical protein